MKATTLCAGTALFAITLVTALGAYKFGTAPPLDGSYILNLGPGAITESAWGDFDDDGNEDFLTLMSGGRLDGLLSAGFMESLLRDIANPDGINRVVRDMTVLRNPNGPDSIALIDQTGLVLVEIHPDLSSLTITRAEFGGFTNASVIDAWSDGYGQHWIAAVHENGGTLYTANNSSGTWEQTTSLTFAPTAALNLALFDKTGTDAAPHVVVLLPVGYGIFDPFGNEAPALFSAPTLTYTDVACLKNAVSGQPDSLAFLGGMTTGPFLGLLTDGQISNFQSLPANEEFYSIASGQYDADIREDLVLAGTNRESLFVLEDSTTSPEGMPTFDYQSNKMVTYSGWVNTAGLQVATPMIVDVDHDGDGDLVIAETFEQQLWVGRNGTIPSSSKTIAFKQGTFNHDHYSADFTSYDGQLNFQQIGVDSNDQPIYDWTIEVDITLPDPTPSDFLEVIA